MTTSTTARVCGEPVADLVTALRGLRFLARPGRHDALFRADRRGRPPGPHGVEAELAAADADSPDADSPDADSPAADSPGADPPAAGSPPGRTHDQRRADALVLLVQRLVASTATTVTGARCPASPEIG